MGVTRILVLFFRGVLRDRTELAAENLALRQQLAILLQKSKTPRLRRRDRIFWALLSQIWANWQSVLLIVQPDTVVGWHRQGFKLYWRCKSRASKVGRPKIEVEIQRLIQRMSRENPLRGNATHPIRTHVAWPHRCRIDGVPIQNPPAQTALTDMASLLGQPHQGHCRR